MITSTPITGALLTIDGTAIPELVSYKVTPAKLWKDADRNMQGDLRATLIGIFTKLELNIGMVNKTRAAAIAAKLNQAYFSVTYFDPSLNANRTAQFYAGDFSWDLQTKHRGLFKPTAVNLIAVSKN